MRPLILTILLALVVSPIKADESEFENEFAGIVEAWEVFALMRAGAGIVYQIDQAFGHGQFDRMADLCMDQYAAFAKHTNDTLPDELLPIMTLLPADALEDFWSFARVVLHGEDLCGWVADEMIELDGNSDR